MKLASSISLSALLLIAIAAQPGCFGSTAPKAPELTLTELSKRSSFLKAASGSAVKWLAWGTAAKEKAESSRQPLFFHVGDSNCVECGGKDPFASSETAKLLNEKSVPVKVDRELQPALAEYIEALARAARGHIGARHDVLLIADADLRPFGAIKAREPEAVRAEIERLLALPAPPEGSLAWREQAEKELAPQAASRDASSELLTQAAERLKNGFDAKNAGLAGTPKSPLDLPLGFLLRFYRRSGDREILEMVELTLSKAMKGAIHDPKGGFFHEAAKDNWSGPLMEKRMGDQALLAIAAMETYQVTGKKAYSSLAAELIELIQEMNAPKTVSENALAVSALARAGLLLNDVKATQRATAWAGSLATRIDDDGVSRTVTGDGRIAGTLEDHVNLIAALLDVYEATSDFKWLGRARDLQEKTISRFWDTDTDSGFFLSDETQPEMPVRAKPVWDRRAPAANAVAALNLLRLGELLTRKDFHDVAEKTLKLAAAAAETEPALAGAALMALDFNLDRAKEIVIVAPQGSMDDSGLLLSEFRRHFVPNRVLIVVESGPLQEEQSKTMPLISKKYPQRGKATAYVCEKGVCKFPTKDPDKFAKLLTDTEKLQ